MVIWKIAVCCHFSTAPTKWSCEKFAVSCLFLLLSLNGDMKKLVSAVILNFFSLNGHLKKFFKGYRKQLLSAVFFPLSVIWKKLSSAVIFPLSKLTGHMNKLPSAIFFPFSTLNGHKKICWLSFFHFLPYLAVGQELQELKLCWLLQIFIHQMNLKITFFNN